jgi:plastocyanin
MRARIVAPVLLVLAMLVLPALAAAAPAAQQTVNVSAADFSFQPATITINAGDTIVWTNTGAMPHTVTASDGSFDSGLFGPGETYSRTFDTAGTISYYCIPHGTPQGGGMAGTIVVQAPAAQPSGMTAHVEVMDQRIENNTVVVPVVVAEQDGWIVIHTNTAENTPGPVIGHAMVMAGENRDVRVTLSETPAPGDRLWPMLHIDAGQMGVYEFPGADTPVRMDGQIVMEQMTVLGDSAEPATSQAPAPEQRPSQLPSTGSAESSNLWALLAGIAAVLLLGGLALGTGAIRSRS